MNIKYKIINFSTLSSTNKYIKDNYKTLSEFTVVSAQFQTEGRGRYERVWQSSKDDNLMFSLFLKPKCDLSRLPLLSLVAGASLQKAISSYIPCTIKWPNDIMINDRKCCGILVEAVSSTRIDAVVVGIGINVNQTDFSDEIKYKATSIKKEINNISRNVDISKDVVLDQFLNIFSQYYSDFLNCVDNNYLDICKNNNYLKNKKACFKNQEVEIIDISDNGNLIINNNGTIEEIFFGEITLANIYNGDKNEKN